MNWPHSFNAGDRSEPLGTVSLDTTARLEDLRLHDDTVRDVLVWAARAVRRVLLMGAGPTIPK